MLTKLGNYVQLQRFHFIKPITPHSRFRQTNARTENYFYDTDSNSLGDELTKDIVVLSRGCRTRVVPFTFTMAQRVVAKRLAKKGVTHNYHQVKTVRSLTVPTSANY